jgi:hypothetical protein
MQVRSGWNSEPYGRRKFDVELGEPDLRRILISHDVDPGTADTMSGRTAFRILYCEAEILARYALLRHLESDDAATDAAADAVKGEIRELQKERDGYLAPLKAKAGKARAREPAAT